MKERTVDMTAAAPNEPSLLERVDEVLILLHQQRRYARTEDEAMELSRAHETLAMVRNRFASEEGSNPIIQPWVARLGLRHQGTLLTAVRGCDTVPKLDGSKALVRCLRCYILVAFVGDPKKAATFIEDVSLSDLNDRMRAVLNDHDHLPHHYFMHLVHAAEILGYYHPDNAIAAMWRRFYEGACRKLHVNAETKAELDERLFADELAFKHAQDV